MVPFSGVNLPALESRFNKTWLNLRESPSRYSWRISFVSVTKTWFFAWYCGFTIAIFLWISSVRENDSEVRTSLPLSIFDISSTSLINSNKCFEEIPILYRQSFTFSRSSMWISASFVIPTIAFIGVRISWDMLDRNTLFDALACSAAATAAFKFSRICLSWVTSVTANMYFSSPSSFTGRAAIWIHICLDSRSLYTGIVFTVFSSIRSFKTLHSVS